MVPNYAETTVCSTPVCNDCKQERDVIAIDHGKPEHRLLIIVTVCRGCGSVYNHQFRKSYQGVP